MLLFLFRLLFRCHWFYSPFHSSWKICNGLLLQLVECIESLKSEVKKKMMMRERMIVVPKSLKQNFASKIFCEELRRSSTPQFHRRGQSGITNFAPTGLAVPR